ncbi:hypothetical protein CMEL01_08111 [Colletotrichum melonis]|uniref:Uncharacterized protein n=1 Tax=Colletotrichum melonis TaxID=1209925 RepID=A0AAI9TZD7_9PEZI|nr:hypothetical protein CMEL01_08111 [Colletotrichum melonis]
MRCGMSCAGRYSIWLRSPPTVREIDARDASAANAMSTWEARRVQAIDYGLEVKSQPRPACRFKQTQKFLGSHWAGLDDAKYQGRTSSIGAASAGQGPKATREEASAYLPV